MDSVDALGDYLGRAVRAKAENPGDDLLSKLVVEHVHTGDLSLDECTAMASLLLEGGFDTTTNMITLGTLALLQHPGQLAELRASDDPKLLANAVEELLRYINVAHNGRRRVALEDVTIAGQAIRAGEAVICSNDAGNRDPQEFPDPEELDIHRDVRRHLGFSYGTHQCIGQPLARVELQVVYGTLYRRIPTLRLNADPVSLPFLDGIVYSVLSLPVAW
jgi:cytochrome P450